MFRIVEKHKQMIQLVLFFSYVIFVGWMTLIIREPRISERVLKLELFWAIRDYLRNVPLGKQEAIQYLLNVVFFVPVGFLFPWKKSWKHVFLIVMILSVAIELTQLIFNLGWCEIDDVVSNTLGSLMGLFLHRLLNIVIGNRGESRV